MDRSASDYSGVQWRKSQACESAACVELARGGRGQMLISGTGQDAVIETSTANFRSLVSGLKRSHLLESQASPAMPTNDLGL
jgi:hypothetical protein